MQYLTYEEYKTWGLPEGSEPPADIMDGAMFAVAEFRARKTIDYWTDSRVQKMETVPEAVKHCVVSLIKLESKYGAEAQIETPLLSSFNNDGYSESYGSAQEQQAAAKKAASDCIRQWLYGETDDEGTPLLYRGVRG